MSTERRDRLQDACSLEIPSSKFAMMVRVVDEYSACKLYVVCCRSRVSKVKEGGKRWMVKTPVGYLQI